MRAAEYFEKGERKHTGIRGFLMPLRPESSTNACGGFLSQLQWSHEMLKAAAREERVPVPLIISGA